METNHNLEQVLPLGVLTGSRAFNCSTNKSDWDIVIFKSNLPDYTICFDYRVTEFNMENLAEYIPRNYSKPGFDLEEYPDLGEDFIEYDQHTIWGPLSQIIKYWDDDENCINLFVYEDKYDTIMDRFRELNQLMNFVYNTKLKDRETRIEAFIKIIKKVGITDLN